MNVVKSGDAQSPVLSPQEANAEEEAFRQTAAHSPAAATPAARLVKEALCSSSARKAPAEEGEQNHHMPLP